MSHREKYRSAIAYATVWIPVALAFSTALGVTGRLSFWSALTAGVLSTLPATLLGIPVVTLCHRFPLTRGRLAISLPLHLVASGVFAALWATAIVGEIAMSATPRDVAAFLTEGLAWQLIMGLLTYAVVAGVASARAAFRRQEEQARAAQRAETLRLRAELEALRARLDPHFLFNVLQTIGALVERQPAETHRALEYLAGLLKRRLVNSRDGDDASLADELQDAREYCALEQLRLGSRLEVVEEIGPSTLELTIPRFTLQPLVENAIRHGLAPHAAPGRLTLHAARVGDRWELQVADNGVGANAERVAMGGGVGLSVVRERIALRYGDRATFEVRTAPGHGFIVALHLPAEIDMLTDTPTGERDNQAGSRSSIAPRMTITPARSA